MVVVALQLADPLGQNGQKRRGIRFIQSPVRKFAPKQIAELVRVIEQARLEDLHVQSRAVEACRHRQLHVPAQRVVGGRGVDAVRIVALVKHEPLVHGLMVDLDRVAVHAHVAHAEIRRHRVRACRDLQIVEVRLPDVPQHRLRYVQPQRRVFAAYLACRGRDLFAAERRLRRDGIDRGRLALEGDDHIHIRRRLQLHVAEGDLSAVDARGDLQARNIALRHIFHPHRLPDTRGARVGAAGIVVAVVDLLARRLEGVSAVVLREDGDPVLAGGHSFRDVKRERRVAADVIADLLTVDVDLAAVIDSAEME